MTIYVIHGVVEGFRPDSFAHLNMLDRGRLAQFLTRKREVGEPFGSLEVARATKSVDALTVDDSTKAAYEACLLLRRLGHAVTWFINPRNVQNGAPYFFARLNTALDLITCEHVRWRGLDFQTSSFSQRRSLRKAIKKAICTRSSEEGMDAVVDEAIESLRVINNSIVPGHLQTVTPLDVRTAHAAGVRIGNHGWTHVEIANLSASELRQHVLCGAAWIRNNTDETDRWYAVPFGRTQVPDECEEVVGGPWFLGEGDPAKQFGRHGWNRSPLKEEALVRTDGCKS